ncbi:MAG: AAA family ATPase [Bacteroidaceae bacterium]|nr:AAA family ATPase [Bacteroidaceae bacterium]
MIEIEKASLLLKDAIDRTNKSNAEHRDEFVTPEQLLWNIAWQNPYILASGGTETSRYLTYYMMEHNSVVPEGIEYECAYPSVQFSEMMNYAADIMFASSAKEMDVPHVIKAIFMLENSYAKDLLMEIAQGDEGSFMSRIIEEYGDEEKRESAENVMYREHDIEEMMAEELGEEFSEPAVNKNRWEQYATCLNEKLSESNPLIGREEELERTIQILCRKDKNNPLHVGEPGVGKTALAYGLAARIEAGDVPERLKGCKIYELDLGALMAGTQYRGDLEKRLKMVLKGMEEQGRVVLYLDEIHNIIGAGRTEGGSLDASNLLKPYLTKDSFRFMGATTYEEYNKHFVRSKAFARRFEKIDILEPTIEECHKILMGLKQKYEEYHGVTYTDEAIRYAVEGAAKYMNGKFLPDKAIDLIDEAGARCECRPPLTPPQGEDSAANVNSSKVNSSAGTTLRLPPQGEDSAANVNSSKVNSSAGSSLPPVGESEGVSKADIAQVLAKICGVDTLAENEDDVQKLEHLEQHIKSQIYGQDKAVKEVTEAVQMASAGLLEDNKPMASLLFVGPTGVGKTEVAKVLASELSLPLVRFDMSEYAEKHTVAKLIGSPAGYVGYEDGGLLTDAVRKTPHCVLLLDELEKAHEDIYNILLQVMDYAVLTDNKGQKADFRHVILLMTTNSGAQHARKANVGFVGNISSGEAMMKKVKSTFKPEFLNRLTGITVFNDMDRKMAKLILDKKLRRLEEQLAAKNVTLELSVAAFDYLLDKGFSAEYGGREVDRVITSLLKPLLMREMLFGKLKNGGKAKAEIVNGELKIENGL